MSKNEAVLPKGFAQTRLARGEVPTVDDHETEPTDGPKACLWRAVIMQALDDLTLPGITKKQLAEREASWQLFFNTKGAWAEWRVEVCKLASVGEHCVVNEARRRLADKKRARSGRRLRVRNG